MVFENGFFLILVIFKVDFLAKPNRGKWGYVEHGAKWNIPLFLHETSFKTCFMQKKEGCFVLPHVPHSPTSPY
jgi:hypothetical protein